LTARKEQDLRGREILAIATVPMIIPRYVEKDVKAAGRVDHESLVYPARDISSKLRIPCLSCKKCIN